MEFGVSDGSEEFVTMSRFMGFQLNYALMYLYHHRNMEGLWKIMLLFSNVPADLVLKLGAHLRNNHLLCFTVGKGERAGTLLYGVLVQRYVVVIERIV